MTTGRKILIAIDSGLVGLGAITSLAGVEQLIGRTTLAWLLLAYVGVTAATRAFEAALHIAPAGYALVPEIPATRSADAPTEVLPLVRR